MNVLANRTKPLRHGYFMLKNRSQEELKAQEGTAVPRADARGSELSWLKASQYKASDRLGVQVLQTALTELLVTQIERSLPSMLKEVEAVLVQTEAELAELGTAPPQLPYGRRTAALAMVRDVVKVLRRITAFADSGTLQFDGPLVLQLELQARKCFAEAVRKTRPGFDGENDRFEEEVTEVEKHCSETLQPGMAEKKVGDRISGKMWSTPQSITTVGEVTSENYPEFGYTQGKIASVSPYFRGDIALRIEAGRGRELPGFMNFDVFTGLMCEYVNLWEKPSREFEQTVRQALSEAADSIADFHASKLPQLAEMMKLELHNHVELCAKSSVVRLNALLGPESLPSTENHYLFDTINSIRNKRMEDKIKAMPSPNGHNGMLQKDSIIAMLKSNVGNDSNESQEVQDMIDFLAAYWKLAMKRYVDEVCMVVSDSLTAPSRVDEIESKLTEALMKTDDQNLERLFQQDHHMERRRLELLDTRTRMVAAQKRITDFISGNMRP